jgi:hypothetical protein
MALNVYCEDDCAKFWMTCVDRAEKGRLVRAIVNRFDSKPTRHPSTMDRRRCTKYYFASHEDHAHITLEEKGNYQEEWKMKEHWTRMEIESSEMTLTIRRKRQ